MTEYFHSIPINQFGAMMLNNVRLRSGFLLTGEIQQALPKGSVISPYTSFNSEQEKEKTWEDIRQKNFPNLPSRSNALFLFDDMSDLNKASELWWKDSLRKTLNAIVLPESKTHKADSKWLNCTEDTYSENASHYWQSEATSDPIFETVVQGIVYFPEWNDFPLLGTNNAFFS